MDSLAPLIFSQGGVAYNKEHIEYWKNKSNANADHARLANANLKDAYAALEARQAEIALLRSQVERLKAPARDCYHIEGCPHWVEACARYQRAEKALKEIADEIAPNHGGTLGAIRKHALATLSSTEKT